MRILAPVMLGLGRWPGHDLSLYLQALSSGFILLSLAGLLASVEPQGARDTILAGVVAKGLLACLGLYALAFGGLTVTFPALLLGMIGLMLGFTALEVSYLTGSKGDFPANLRLEGNR
jgi:hypothetical protein